MISSQTITSSRASQELAGTNSTGTVTTNTWDGDNLIRKVVTSSSGVVVSSLGYSYDTNGNVLTTTDAVGDVAADVYDGDMVVSETVTTSPTGRWSARRRRLMMLRATSPW